MKRLSWVPEVLYVIHNMQQDEVERARKDNNWGIKSFQLCYKLGEWVSITYVLKESVAQS